MTIDSTYLKLINAEIDDEISAADKARLEVFLAEDAEAREYRVQLRALAGDLDAMPAIPPPADLRQSILSKIRPAHKMPNETNRGLLDMIHDFFAVPVVGYAVSFVAGAAVSLALISSNGTDQLAYDDVTSMVGTIGASEIPDGVSAADRLLVSGPGLAGAVNLRGSGTLLVLDFDLSSQQPVEIVVSFDDRDISFNGFAQQESAGTSMTAETGSVTLGMEGQRRYSVYLDNAGRRAAIVNLSFYSSGQLLQTGILRFEE